MDHIFREDVYKLVQSIPSGRLMTYGQIAAICGHPGAARVVGQIAHFGPSIYPWHRVVNINGGLAVGFVPDGQKGQQALLLEEGFAIKEYKIVNLERYLWQPSL